ncbi:TonB-dependent receptor [Shinella sp. CPCC 101442]|uniref:TonB-dependent receptor domain-containing protein n=1 Tax=Shinella sp. CPCC 101442 TaxID=2932265 RepID=UPI0021532685|nr:TonB-dependent receptor [Shinella sp. CPCC 101442]MCR6500722.1 TonB-dependent receptor [Shinella sp. CPCC 101442]
MAFVGGVVPAFADVLPRASTADGAVVERKSGEEVQFVEAKDWQGVEVNQDLLAGDTLRTNALGSLAIRFADNTLVRMARETVLRVRKIDGTSDSLLNLEGGTIWGRAQRGGSGIVIDTPAAAAAIRGTDWALNTNGTRTTLTVLEGTVELSNAHGSVTVNQGEGAVATLGEAPRKYVLVNLEEREQILLYGEIRGMFITLPISGENTIDARGDRRRLLDKPEASRSREDWLKLAELALPADGRQVAEDALSHLPRPLPAALEARAVLVEAMIAGNALRYGDAIRLFREARPRLSGERRVMADYGEWIASSLAYPDKKKVPAYLTRTPATPGEASVQASVVAHLQGQAAAIALLAQAEKRFPDDAGLPAMRASLALELDRRDEARAALDRARSIDPDDVGYLTTNARYRSVISSDIDGALADLKRAIEIAPGDDAAWDDLAGVQSDRDATMEADAAHRRAVALNPENIAVRTNYALFLMGHEQMADAKRELDAAEALDPNTYAVLAAKGRYLLRMGKTEEGKKVLLEAAAINPTYGGALIGLAIASYQSGAVQETEQALDNADRFDKDNPSIAMIRAGVAIDQFRADDAIRDAREGLRRRQARGGFYSGYDVHRQASSVLGDALENLGLDEWGKYHKARAYDPFLAASYDDEQSAGQLSPFVVTPPSGLYRYGSGSIFLPTNIQNFLLDPLGVASQQRANSIESRAFFETSVIGGFSAQPGVTGWNGDVSFHGTNYDVVPLSYNFMGQISRPESVRENDRNDFEGGAFELGLRPTLADNVYLFGHLNRARIGYPGQLFYPTPNDALTSKGDTIGGGWSHTISEKNVVQAFAMYEHSTSLEHYEGFDWDINPEGDGGYTFEQTSEAKSLSGGVSHLFGVGPFTMRYGAELYDSTSWNVARYFNRPADDLISEYGYPSDWRAARLYADATLDVSNDLKLQAGAYYSWFDSKSGTLEEVDPRFGIAWTPVENHWLRAAYRRDTQYPVTQTLSPVSTVGLVPLSIPLFIQGEKDTTMVRWDAEWSDRFFTSLDYQHVTFDGSSIGAPGFASAFETATGEIDRVNVSANYWVGEGLGLFGSFTWYDSKDTTFLTGGDLPVPLVPDYVGQVGFTYVHPSRITFSLAQTFVGERTGVQGYDLDSGPFVIDIDSYTTTDAALTWKSQTGHLELGLTLLNIFDNHVDMAFDVPGPRRSFLATLKANF